MRSTPVIVSLCGMVLAAGAWATDTSSLDAAHKETVQRVVARYLTAGEMTSWQRLVVEDGLREFASDLSKTGAEGLVSSGVRLSKPRVMTSGELDALPLRALLDEEPELPPGGPGSEPEPVEPPAGPEEQQPDGVEGAPQPVLPIGGIICIPGNELLIGARFAVAVTVQDLVGNVFVAGSCRMTNLAGYFFFFDPTNVEIPVKMLNGCGGAAPPTHWIFFAGLTNFGVRITFFDLFTGISLTYTNPVGQTMPPVIDQQTPFPCP